MKKPTADIPRSIFDASFRYRPSRETDIRKTFERVRRERAAAASKEADGALPQKVAPQKVAPIALRRGPA